MQVGGRQKAVAAVAALVVLLGLGTVLVRRDRTEVRAGTTGAVLSSEAGPFTRNDRPAALIMGDSFAEGITGVERPGGGLARQVAQQMGWSLTLDGQGGTGYVADGPVERFPDRAPFPVRMLRHGPEERISYVLLTGGANDSSASTPVLEAAVGSTIDTARRLWPTATVVVVPPIWVHAATPKGVLRIRDAVVAAAAARQVRVIDPLAEHWTTPENESWVGFTDGVHPSQRGHDYYAGRLVQSLVAAGVPQGEQLRRTTWFPTQAVPAP